MVAIVAGGVDRLRDVVFNCESLATQMMKKERCQCRCRRRAGDGLVRLARCTDCAEQSGVGGSESARAGRAGQVGAVNEEGARSRIGLCRVEGGVCVGMCKQTRHLQGLRLIMGSRVGGC